MFDDKTPEGGHTDPIAIVGVSCNLPGGADSPDKFWKLLLDKTDAITDIPADRWDRDAYYNPDFKVGGHMNVNQGGFLNDITMFDAGFFGVPPIEAVRIDPQHRLLLENTYLAFEDAGYRLEDLAGSRTGVFIGISSHDYGDIHNAYDERMNLGPHSNTGNAQSIASNRISYTFNLMGPSFSVDTACSSSLIAAHLACRSIWYGESDVAVVGGVNAILKPELQIGFSRGGFLSPDSRCFCFDARANGYIRSEGVGIVLLKSLSKAIQDGDKIYATIIGSAINEDGRTPGISMPNREAQIAVLKEAYADAAIDPGLVDYVEAHGTGTAVGDPIEADALGTVIGGGRNNAGTFLIGSVKSNIGHLEPASGAAGLIKLAMTLKNRTIPPNVHFETPNPKIDFEGLKLDVPTKATPLPKDRDIYAGINSFGFGGANAHLVLKTAPIVGKADSTAKPNVTLKSTDKTDNKAPASGTFEAARKSSLRPFVISARSEDALRAMTEEYIRFISETDADLDAVAAAAAMRRSSHDLRMAAVTDSKEELAEMLQSYLDEEDVKTLSTRRVGLTTAPKTAFVFSGQGPQWYAMGRELLETNPTFRACLERIDGIFKELGWLAEEKSSLMEELAKDEESSRINETEIAQPAIFALQVALAEVWKDLGITPDAIVGHSIGEAAASCVSGALSLEEATRVVYWRSRCQVKAAGLGKMMAVGLSEKKITSIIRRYKGAVDIAAVNAPKMVTLSGEGDALEDLADRFEEDGTFYRMLIMDVPFHSHLLAGIEEEFKTSVGTIHAKKADVALYSTVEGGRIDGSEMDTEYWYRNIRRPVLYYPTVRQMVKDGYETFVEVGPHPILSNGVNDAFKDVRRQGTIVPTLRRKEPEWARMLLSLGELHCWGYPVQWELLFGRRESYPDLPRYKWQKESYWIERDESKKRRLGLLPHPHLTEHRNASKEEDLFIWDVNLDYRSTPYIGDHRVQGPLVYPGAGHVDLSIGVGLNSYGDSFGFVEDFNFHTALFLPDEGDPYPVQFEVHSDNGNFVISSKNSDDAPWVPHSNGKLNHIGDEFYSKPVSLEELKKSVTNEVDLETLFQELWDGGLQLGPTFRGLSECWKGEGLESLGHIVVHESIRHGFSDYNIHPAILDACFQTAFGMSPDLGREPLGVYIPVHIDRIKFFGKPEGFSVWSYTKALEYSEEQIYANVWIMNEDGSPVAEIQGFTAQYLKGSKGEVAGRMDNWLYEYVWQIRDRYVDSIQRDPNSYLTAPSDMAKAGQEDAEAINNDPIVRLYLDEFEAKLDELTLAYIADALDQLGFEFKPGAEIRIEELADELEVVERHRRLFNHMFLLLSEHDYTEKTKDGWKILAVPPTGHSDTLLETLSTKYHDFDDELILTGRCGPHLADVLTGATDPVQLIFPEKDWDSVVEYYINSISFRQYNVLMRQAIQRLIAEIPEDQTIRVLEIGAGTGGMTQAILPCFPADRTEYIFTDISPMFSVQAKKRFGKYPFVSYNVYDADKDPAAQGYDPGSFDIVVASDVIHATKSIADTIGNARKLLAPGGVLAMLEVTKAPIYLELIFGMTEGWWAFEDLDLRPVHCSLSTKAWMNVLPDLGFDDVVALADDPDSKRTSQTVFLCRNEQYEYEEELKREIDPGKWLVFADTKGFGTALIEGLSKKGMECVTVTYGDEYSFDGGAATVDPIDKEHYARLLEDVGGLSSLSAMLHTWALDSAEIDEISAERLESDQKISSAAVAALSGAIVDTGAQEVPRFWLFTSEAGSLPGDTTPVISQSPLWGLLRVIVHEPPMPPATIVDVSRTPSQDELGEIMTELLTPIAPMTEEEIAFRGKKRFTHKFVRVIPAKAAAEAAIEMPASGGAYHAEIDDHGVLDTVVLRAHDEAPLGDDEVRIDVKAAPLNFRDVMVALGLLSGDAISGGVYETDFGLECSGVIREVGSNVQTLQPGDEVVALAGDCIAGSVTAKACHAIGKPKALSFQEAATLPMVYVTAYYSLVHQARMEAGERVLIHAGAGGVGIAAIRIALAAGAEVFATASEPKQEFLRSLGVKHVYNSRDTKFYDGIMADTEGEGVDIVLNSLAGKMLTQSIKCLAPYGRFVEIGKADIYSDKRIGLKPFGDNLSYFAVDIDRMLKQKPELAGRLFTAVIELFEENNFPAHPVTEFGIQEAAEAFRYMTQGRHMGKVVLSLDEGTVKVQPPKRLALRGDGTYLIVGGCGGLGLAIAKWMTGRGARHLALMARSGVKNDEDQAVIDGMLKDGIDVRIIKADVTSKQDVEKAVKEIESEMAPLKGVINSALVLEDAMLPNQDYERFMRVMRPKMTGTWILHEATLDCDLDYFVMFSSVAAQFGTPGQANYAAANGFLDMFAYYRRSLGLPGMTINWGVLGDVGFVSRTEKVFTILSNQGWTAFRLRDTLAILERMLIEQPILRGAADSDWEKVKDVFSNFATSVRFAHLLREKIGDMMGGGGQDAKLRETVLSIEDDGDRLNLLEQECLAAVAKVLGTSAAKMDPGTPITKMGLDSLMANQLRSWVSTNVGIDYSLMRIMQGPSTSQLAMHLLEELEKTGGHGAGTSAEGETPWVVRPVPRPDAKVRLFCFAYMGGGASIYNNWAEALPEDVEACLVQLPGREERLGEEPIYDNEELLDELVENILPFADKPIAFYGHSFGAVVATYTAHRLQEDHGITLAHIFVAASAAPQVHNPLSEIFDKSDVEAETPDEIPEDLIMELLEKLETPDTLIGSEEMLERTMPAIRADLLIMRENRRQKPAGALDCPMTIFYGERDSVYPVDLLRPWSEFAGNGNAMVAINGGHLFIHEDEGKVEVLEKIGDALATIEVE